ncbi:uncharacterized protein CMU_032410 [Cryptosporidium muris RN66]|uniref:D-glutamate cyclase-like C-terminal domain-containing protein n=1 Tax=Cryptosporidium muris (strain RN66) TaxID=441375 RepID=B6AIQ8_CRYMR|nr:uncharacterized protein CMU_032410 [Cryptosporidium muris RN66]EEA08099.1 hypothetical protein, conserved [Cryptosporidium muris RN66]|eukprot:XP_002142448.1 hypothetical protein [Cryptosporidium muris RN66]
MYETISEYNSNETMEKITLPKHYNDTDTKLSIEEAIFRLENLMIKDTISPKKCIKDKLINTSSLRVVSELLISFANNQIIKEVSEEIITDITRSQDITSMTKVVGILALSPSNVSHLPPTELDGVTGLMILTNALSNIGISVVIMTDSINQPIMKQMFEVYDCNYKDIHQEIGYPPDVFELEQGKIYIVGVVPLPGITDEWQKFLDKLYKKFQLIITLGRIKKDLSTGIYRNTRGLRMNHYCADIDSIFYKAKEDCITTIAISDFSYKQLGSDLSGDHEINNENTYIDKNNENKIISDNRDKERISKYLADHILVGHTVDWVCYFLTSCIGLLYKKSEISQIIDNLNNNKELRTLPFEDFLPQEETFQTINNKILELEIWDSKYGSTLKKGFSYERDWEVRMKIRRVAAQVGLPVYYENA